MTERELVLRERAAAVKALIADGMPWCTLSSAEQLAARLFPLPARTVPTVRQGPSGFWYRVADGVIRRYVERYGNADNARNRVACFDCDWSPEDQPTVAALLALPLTEEVEDTGEDGAS